MSVDALRAALLAGGVGIVPTDTVYGLAAALDTPAGVAALYAIKGRPRSQPCQVLMYTSALLEEAVAPLDERTISAVRALLPGPVTCLIPDPPGRYAAAAGASVGTVGLRAPGMDPPLLLDIPLVATSANDPGGPDAASIDEIPGAIRGAVAAILDRGVLRHRPSTVVDLRELGVGGPARLARMGGDAEALTRRLTRLGVVVEPSRTGE